MSGDGILFSKLNGQRVKFGKRLTTQHAAETTGCAAGMTIPKASGQRWGSGSQKTEDGASQESQFRQAVNAVRRMDKLAMSTDHVFSRQWNLLDRPAAVVEGAHSRGLAKAVG